MENQIEYILDEIPKNTHTSIEGWRDMKGHIWKASYSSIQSGRRCLICFGNVPKVVDDYHELASIRNFKFAGDKFPQNIQEITKWKCKFDHAWKACYNNIRNGNGCPECTNRIPKNLDNYKDIAKSKGFEYILNEIPKTTQDSIDGWKDIKGHIWSSNYNGIQQNHGCPLCKSRRSEKLCREILQELFEVKFPTKKPLFLRGLELDCYNEDLKLALEYNGKQHYEFVEFFHKTEEKFNKLKERDQKKYKLCEANNIKLIIVPYQYSYLDEIELYKYILDELKKLNVEPKVLVLFDTDKSD